MAGRLVDYIAQGLAANLPTAATVDGALTTGAHAFYYATDTQILYNLDRSGTPAWDQLAQGVTALDNLSDVDTSTVPPTDGQTLIWDSTDGEWQPGDVSPGGGVYNGARSTLSANLTTVNASGGYLVPFDTEVRDVGGWHDPSTNNTRHTVPAGVTRIGIAAALAADNVTAGEVAVLSLWKNGAALNPSPGQQASPTAALTSVYCSIHSGDLDVSENDYFELRLFCSDSSITIREANTFFDIKAES